MIYIALFRGLRKSRLKEMDYLTQLTKGLATMWTELFIFFSFE